MSNSTAVADLGSITAPRYRLFDVVRVVAYLESGWTNDHGVITGVIFEPPDQRGSGWYYQVRFEELPSCPWLKMPYSGLAAEFEVFPALDDRQRAGLPAADGDRLHLPVSEEWVSAGHAAKKLGIPVNRLHYLRKAGYFKCGYHFCYISSPLEDYVPRFLWSPERIADWLNTPPDERPPKK